MAGVKGRSGGARQGAGRPRKSKKERALAGSRDRVRKPQAAFVGSTGDWLDEGAIACPAALGRTEAAVWAELSPLAQRSGKLTPDMVPAFTLLCAQAAAEREMRVTEVRAWGADHRGLIRLVELGMARFRIQPDGRPPVDVEPAKDGFEEFDAPAGPWLVEKRA